MIHVGVIVNVDLMLQLNKELEPVPLPDRREQLRVRTGHADDKIDWMVYLLYGLTVEEIAVVEHTG